MRVLIFHGYLLRGTGSNVYNASLAQALRRRGHEVHLLCQDRGARRFPWVGGEGAGSVTVHIPDIGGLLPVYVADRYEGFEVKTFPDLSDAELERYLEANVAAVLEVISRVGPPDAALANHLVLAPAILARAGLRFALKVHGSDLSYTLRQDPERYGPFAREGVEAAAGVLVGSAHTAADLFAVAPAAEAKTRLGPPGIDVERFRPRPRPEADAALEDLADRLEAAVLASSSSPSRRNSPQAAGSDSFARDRGAAAALRKWMQAEERVLSVGKLIVNKGIDLLVAAWPLIHRRRRAAGRSASLLLVGFGAYRPGAEALIDALGRGDLEAARAVAARGRGIEGHDQRRPQTPPPNQALPILAGFLSNPPEGYAAAAKDAAGSILLCGRLEHEEVAEVMPAADAFAMPSTFPEAFGMVPAEAAACGVPPVSADHSGMAEVSRRLARALPPEQAGLLSFAVGPDAVGELAECLWGWLELAPGRRREAGVSLARRVGELWSWERVAAGVLAASRGELEELPRVG